LPEQWHKKTAGPLATMQGGRRFLDTNCEIPTEVYAEHFDCLPVPFRQVLNKNFIEVIVYRKIGISIKKSASNF